MYLFNSEILFTCSFVSSCWSLFLDSSRQAVNAVALVRSGAAQSLLDLDGVLRVMKDGLMEFDSVWLMESHGLIWIGRAWRLSRLSNGHTVHTVHQSSTKIAERLHMARLAYTFQKGVHFLKDLLFLFLFFFFFGSGSIPPWSSCVVAWLALVGLFGFGGSFCVFL